MRRKIAVLLIFLILSCYINVFAKVLQRSNMNKRNLLYNTASDSQIRKATDSESKKATCSEIKSTKDIEINIEDEVFIVSFPANIHAYLDPDNLSGKGQVFSDLYMIKNYGYKDITIKITNIDINYWSDEYVYEFSKEKITATPSQIKKMNVDMIWENKSEKKQKVLNILDSEPNQYVLSLKAAKYDNDGELIELNSGSIGSFYFTGTLNSNPNFVWEDGEITLNFDYEIINKGRKEEIGED